MQNLRNKLIAGGAVVILAAIGTVMNRQAAQAAGGPTVTIDPAQLPLPVTAHVANGITAPVPVLDISKSASQHVGLLCYLQNGGPICANNSFPTTPYVVPAGENLVVTSVDILDSVTEFIDFSSAFSGAVMERYRVAGDALTHSFQYPSGIVFPAGYSFTSPRISFSGAAELYLQGFLTSN